MRLKLPLIFVFISIYSWSQTTTTFTSSGSFVVAAGLTSLTAECWGAGGAGGGNDTGASAGGGGGGGYSRSLITITPNSTINYTVGAGGAGSLLNGVAGSASTFSTVSAGGGGGGTSGSGAAAGIGGASGTGTFIGGKGGNGSIVIGALYAGGGGSSAGTALSGNNGGLLGAGGAGVAGGGAGGAGGFLDGAGAPGAVPGGGGGGGLVLLGVKKNGGNGGNGQIRITYTCPTYNISATAASNACLNGTSSVQLTSTAALLPVGNYTVTYTLSNPSGPSITAPMNVTTAGTGSFDATGFSVVGSSTITIIGLTSGTCSSTISTANTATITVSPLSVGGSAAGGTTICSGLTSAVLTLSGQTGTVVNWQSSISPFSAWTDIPSSANATYTSGVLTQTTQFRAVVKSGACTIATSSATTVTVNPLPNAPTATATQQPTCQDNSGTITVSSPVSGTGFSYSRDGIDYTNTSGIFSGLNAGTYNIRVRNNTTGCISPVTSIIINPLVTKVWNGSANSSWSNAANWTPSGVPLASDCVDIPNVGFSPVISGTDGTFFANRLTVENNGSLTVQGTNTIIVTNEVKVLGTGIFTFENNSSLVQTSNSATNVGNIIYKRETKPVRRYDATHWSSPVTRVPIFRLYDLSPGTLLDKYFKYDPSTGWVTILNGTEEMVKGVGYSIRSPQSNDITVPQIYPGQFVGVPNNGDILGPSVVAEKYSLFGNPYPSAIYADQFIHDNAANIYGTIYIWTHNTQPQQNSSGDGLYYYSNDDYAIYNLSGSVVVGSMVGTPSPNPGNQSVPQGYIAAGQGFFVKARTNQRSLFTNSMRVSGRNSQFYKSSQTNEIEKHRVWLNLYNAQGAFKQLLIGYAEGATNFWDNNFDAVSLDAHPIIDFYSINEGKKLVIQGRALPFTVSDTVSLGYRSAWDGEFTIAIDHSDGNLSNQTIYLQDNETKKIHNLTESSYTFRTAIGIFQKRFVLRYTDPSDTLGNTDFTNLEGNISVSVKDKSIKLQSFSESENLEETSIYDSGGKLLYNKKGIDSKEWIINNLRSGPQVLLVKITLDNGQTVTKKVIFN